MSYIRLDIRIAEACWTIILHLVVPVLAQKSPIQFRELPRLTGKLYLKVSKSYNEVRLLLLKFVIVVPVCMVDQAFVLVRRCLQYPNLSFAYTWSGRLLSGHSGPSQSCPQRSQGGRNPPTLGAELYGRKRVRGHGDTHSGHRDACRAI
jgi:hypothetical protein